MFKNAMRTRIARLDSNLPATYTGARILAYYRMNNEATDWRDSIGSNHLTASGNVAFGTGILSECLSVTGAAIFLHIADASGNLGATVDDQTRFWAAWVQLSDLSAARPIITKLSAAGNREMYLHYLNTSSRFQVTIYSDGTAGTTRSASSFGAPSVDTWYLVMAWHDPIGGKIGIQINDGEQDLSGYSAGMFDSTANYRIGQREESGLSYRGLIDEVLVSNRILTRRERSMLYKGGLGRTYPFFPEDVILDI